MDALRRYRRQYFGEELSHEVLEEIYDKVGGRLSFLNRVAKAKDYMKLCDSICEAEKRWFLNKCWILGPEMDDDVMDEQKYSVSTIIASGYHENTLTKDDDSLLQWFSLKRLSTRRRKWRKLMTRKSAIFYHRYRCIRRGKL